MKKFKALLLLTVAVMFGAATLTGCQTTHGFGEDLESVGETIQDGTAR